MGSEAYEQWLREVNGVDFYKIFKDPQNLESYLDLVEPGKKCTGTDYAKAFLLKGIVNFFRPSGKLPQYPHLGHYWIRRSEDEEKWLPKIGPRTYRSYLDEFDSKGLIIRVRRRVGKGDERCARRYVRPDFNTLLTIYNGVDVNSRTTVSFMEIDEKPVKSDCQKNDIIKECQKNDNDGNVRKTTLTVIAPDRVLAPEVALDRIHTYLGADAPDSPLTRSEAIEILSRCFGNVNMEKGKGHKILHDLNKAIGNGWLTREICEFIRDAYAAGHKRWDHWVHFTIFPERTFGGDLPELLDSVIEDESASPELRRRASTIIIKT